MNRDSIVLALRKGGNEDVTVVTLPGANHLFQQAITGSNSEYVTLEKAFIPGFLGLITDWILEKSTATPAGS